MTNTIKIATHSGKFHTDELVAIALMQMAIGKDTKVEIVRTRCEDKLQDCDVLVDVGRKFQNLVRYQSDGMTYTDLVISGTFDHHQFKDGDANYGLSSAGLVYRALTEKVEVVETMSGQYLGASSVLGKGLEAFIDHVDERDNFGPKPGEGKRFHEVCELINSCNLADLNGSKQDLQFAVVLDIVKALLNEMYDKPINSIWNLEDSEWDDCSEYKLLEELAKKTTADNAVVMANRPHETVTDGVAIYGEFFPTWREIVEDNLFVTPGDNPGEYKVMCDTNDIKIISAKDSKFVHNGGWFAVIKPNGGECMVTVELSSDSELIDIHFNIEELKTLHTK